MLRIKNTDINLKDTITCGQIFRYEENDDNSYTVILSDRVVNLKKENNDLIITSNKEDNLENVVVDYLDLKRNYNLLNQQLIKVDKTKEKIINSCAGLKMIHQPKFECLISYIISQNNRVPQIKKTLDNISFKYGDKVIFNNKEYYLFPKIEKLKNVQIEDYRNLKCGFRDKYIYEIVKNINDKNIDLDLIDNMQSADALNYLMKNKGIGQKVASCILLFAYSRFDVYPIDTWVKKYMKDTYSITDISEIKNYTKNKYNENSGLIIQYMFHYKRNKEN